MTVIPSSPAGSPKGAVAATFGPSLAPQPWTIPTPDRLLRTTATVVSFAFKEIVPWTQTTAPFTAVSPVDPATGQRYFCLVVQPRGFRFDFGLNPVSAPNTTSGWEGMFTAAPVEGGFSGFAGWGFAIASAPDSASNHYFLSACCAPDAPNTLMWTPMDERWGILGSALPRQYHPKNATVEPQGLWVTDDVVWFANSDQSLWRVNLSDILANTSASLAKVASTGLVQAVISDNSESPTYYVFSAVSQPGAYDLVEFPAGNPSAAVTIDTGWTLGQLRTTPDGGVWKVAPDFNPPPGGPSSAKVALLVPSYPASGLAPAWFDPLANADPSLVDPGLGATIIDAAPLSATNVLLWTTANLATDEQALQWPNAGLSIQITRLGVGVLDQPAQTFPAYSGDLETAYQIISGQLISPGPNLPQNDDIRSTYPELTAALASAYFAAVTQLAMPSGFTDSQAWATVVADLQSEFYNLTSVFSFWENMTTVIGLKNAVQSNALTYAQAAVSIPSSAKLIVDTPRSAGILSDLAGGCSGAGSVFTGVAALLSVAAPEAGVAFGVMSAGASLVSVFLSIFGSHQAPQYTIKITDPMYQVSAKLADVSSAIGDLFNGALAEIGSSAAACAKDPGRLATVALLFRNGLWGVDLPTQPAVGGTTPDGFQAYYNACVVSFLRAFTALAAAQDTVEWLGEQPTNWTNYSGKPVYVGPMHWYQTPNSAQWCSKLLQYASTDDPSKPLSTNDLETIIFTTFQCDPADVFPNWGIPSTPSWL